MLGESESIAIPQSSKYAHEMRKWEAHPTKYGAPGRPFKQMEYPKMLYKCEFVIGKGIQKGDNFIVNDATEEANMNSRGYLPLQVSYDAALKTMTEHGKLAAEREYMIVHGHHSEAAIKEIRAAEEAFGSAHMPDMPEKPIRRKAGRPKKEKVSAHA